MGEEIDIENGEISGIQGLVTLTLLLDIYIYCIPSSITDRPLPTYQIYIEIEKHFVDGQTGGHLRPTLLG